MKHESDSNQPLELEVMDIMMALAEAPKQDDLASMEAALTTIVDEMQRAVDDSNHVDTSFAAAQEALKNAAPELVKVMRKVLAFDGALNKLQALAEKVKEPEMALHHQQLVLIFEGFLEAFFKYINIFERLFEMMPGLGSSISTNRRRTAADIVTEVQRITERKVPIRSAISLQTLVLLATIARVNSESTPEIN